MPRSAPDQLARPTPAGSAPVGASRVAGAAARPSAAPAAVGAALPWLLLLGGLVGLAAALVLTVEKVALLADPGYVPSCSINPVLSCGSVMASPQASVLGFPNALLGVVGFSVVATTGAALLAGAQLSPWFWRGLQAGVTLGAAFVHWLIFQSLYRIGALCPYCMVVWAVTVPVFWYVTLRNLTSGALPVPRSCRPAVTVLARYHTVALTVWFLTVVALVGQRFWPYWSLLLSSLP